MRVLMSALATATAGGRSLAKAGHLPDGFAPFCEGLLARVRENYATTAATCDPSAAVADVFPGRIRVGGNVQAANLVHKVTPAYPDAAKQRGIQGAVRFTTIVGTDGRLSRIELVSGPLPLYAAARDAVAQWVYKPTLLNGQPVEVLTQIDVNFVLGR